MQAAKAKTFPGPIAQLARLHPADPETKTRSAAAEVRDGTYTRRSAVQTLLKGVLLLQQVPLICANLHWVCSVLETIPAAAWVVEPVVICLLLGLGSLVGLLLCYKGVVSLPGACLHDTLEGCAS